MTDPKLSVGDTFTLQAVRQLDRRRWPRFKAWVLRRPRPMLGPVIFKVTSIVGGKVTK